jgi:hypothetical protein
VVRYEEGDLMDPASLWIVMRPGATKAEAVAFACDVVQPAITSGRPPKYFAFFIWDDREQHLLADSETSCGEGSNGSSSMINHSSSVAARDGVERGSGVLDGGMGLD